LLIKMSRPKFIEKPWGHEEVLYETSDFVVLRMFIKKGEETSLHKHLNRDEYFIIVRGIGSLFLGKRRTPIKKGKMIHIRKGQEHLWMADEDLEIIEVTTPPLNDLVRIEDKYGRIKGVETNE